jgi:hypothetical protein
MNQQEEYSMTSTSSMLKKGSSYGPKGNDRSDFYHLHIRNDRPDEYPVERGRR